MNTVIDHELYELIAEKFSRELNLSVRIFQKEQLLNPVVSFGMVLIFCTVLAVNDRIHFT